MERDRRNRYSGTYLRWLLILSAVWCSLAVPVKAQEAASCENLYQEALRLYNDAQLGIADHLADSLTRTCTDDRDQMARILFLRTLIAAREDSIPAMQRNLERLFRNDRNYVLKPYDPLLIAIPERDELYTEYQLLFGSREMGPGALRKDHGRFRAGFTAALICPQLEVTTERVLFAEDGPTLYSPEPGWSAGAVVEYDVFPNWAVRLSGGIASYGYRARNNAVFYEEQLNYYDGFLGLRKSFWLKDPRWVPFLLAGGGMSILGSAEAAVDRRGDGVKLLGPYTSDRVDERARYQYRAIAGAGVAYKMGHTVLSLECRYEYAFSDHTLEEAPWTESEYLLRYYYADNDLRISNISVCLGLQYIIRYHTRNRIHP